MASHEQQKMELAIEQQKMEHFSHKHPLTLIEIEEDEKEESKSEYRSSLRCYGCTEKISSGVPYYRCEEHCPFFCLHHSCAHLPNTIQREHLFNGCDVDILQLMKCLYENSECCFDCDEGWYRFGYACSVCKFGVDIRCAATRRRNEAKFSFHEHPVQPWTSRPADDLICSVCSLIIKPRGSKGYKRVCVYYRCNDCNFMVHPKCTHVPLSFISPSHPHKLFLHLDYVGSKICKICQEEIEPSTQWAYFCGQCDGKGKSYYIHAANDDCLASTIRKGDFQHFGHDHPLTLVEEEEEEAPPLDGDHSMAQDCHCCRQKIPSVPHYTCIHCNKYHLHKLCAHLPRKVEHPLHLKCPLYLLAGGLSVSCDECDEECNGFFYLCYPCNFYLDIECALRTQKIDKIFHKHPLFLSPTKGPYKCHACDRDTDGTSYQCTSCKFWVHHQCASLPTVKKTSTHDHDLELIYAIPEKFSGVVVYCQICTKAMKQRRWAYYCKRCRYLTHIHDCSDPHREGNGVTINASDVVHLPLAGEPILEEKLTNGKMTEYHRNPMILFADQFESNGVDIARSFKDLIRGSTTWPTFHADGKDYSGFTFSFHNSRLTMQVTSADLPRYIKHEAHPHVLESTFLNSSTWCHACEQTFFGRGFKCTTCAFTIDTYCALLPRIIKHRYDKHGFELTYSAIEEVEEYVCEICEKDVIPKYFYHCERCDQSIHARCIWKAYVGFESRYRFGRDRRLVNLVPPTEDLPQCLICHQKETFGHGFAFTGPYYGQIFRKSMVHLTCISEDDVYTY